MRLRLLPLLPLLPLLLRAPPLREFLSIPSISIVSKTASAWAMTLAVMTLSCPMSCSAWRISWSPINCSCCCWIKSTNSCCCGSSESSSSSSPLLLLPFLLALFCLLLALLLLLLLLAAPLSLRPRCRCRPKLLGCRALTARFFCSCCIVLVSNESLSCIKCLRVYSTTTPSSSTSFCNLGRRWLLRLFLRNGTTVGSLDRATLQFNDVGATVGTLKSWVVSGRSAVMSLSLASRTSSSRTSSTDGGNNSVIRMGGWDGGRTGTRCRGPNGTLNPAPLNKLLRHSLDWRVTQNKTFVTPLKLCVADSIRTSTMFRWRGSQ